MPLSTEQRAVLSHIWSWLQNPQQPSLTLGGYAGTGKTTLIASLNILLRKHRPKWKIAFASYTGKATQVLAEKMKRTGIELGHNNISTLHSLLYAPMVDKSGNVSGWRRRAEIPYDLLVIDEASMLTPEIWKDALRVGIPILAVGDHGQLPPIGESFNLMKEPDLVLQHIHRQALESPILQVATLAREEGQIPVQKFGAGVEKFHRQSSDAQLILDEFIHSFSSDSLFLTGYNKSRQRMNGAIREALLHESPEPEIGDQLICLRNNWEHGIFNGMVGRLSSVTPVREEGETVSYKVDIENSDGAPLYSGLINAKQFGSESTLKISRTERKRFGELFDFGYALTVHKAQGSQAKRVIIVEERTKYMTDEDWSRWLYTAVTRAEEELFVFGA